MSGLPRRSVPSSLVWFIHRRPMHAASDRSGIFDAQLLVFDALHAGMREPIDGQSVFMLFLNLVVAIYLIFVGLAGLGVFRMLKIG
jgi:hypothetical protein